MAGAEPPLLSRRRRAALLALLACGILGGSLLLAPLCAADPAVAAPVAESAAEAAAARRARALAIAERYATFRWTASPENVLHGDDPDGVRVDTPDAGHRPDGFHADGRVNTGIPYSWGGFSTPEEFERGLAEGKLAGHLPAAESAAGSEHTVGVDCSGFVSRCWGLPIKQTTRTLGTIAVPLEGYGKLLPGDLLNSGDGHAVLFRDYVGAARKRVRVFEAGFPKVMVSEYSVAELEKQGLRPYRYAPFDPSWAPLPLAAPTLREAQIGEFRATGPAAAAPAPAGDAGLPAIDLGRAGSGSFARYRGVREGSGETFILTLAVAGREGDGIELRRSIGAADPTEGAIDTRERVAASRPLLGALADISLGEQRPTELVTRSVTRTPGVVAIAGEERPAERIESVETGVWIQRKVRYDATLRIEAIQSDSVPLHGIIALREVLELREGERLVGRIERSFRLIEARRAPDAL